MQPAPPECQRCLLGAACPRGCIFVRTSVPRGHVFFEQGDEPRAAHFLRRGLVVLTEENADGNVVRQHLKPAGSLLDPAVVREAHHRARATAVTRADVCTLPLPALHHWLGPRQSPARALLELTLREAQLAAPGSARPAHGSLAQVAAFLLEHLAEGDERPLELQHQLVAGLLGMRPETLSRCLTRLRSAGAISRGRRLRVLDRPCLQALAR